MNSAPVPTRSDGGGVPMSSVLSTTPARTQAAILRTVLSHSHPKLALGSIASHFNMTMADLRVIIDHHGYPRGSAMSAAAIALDAVPDTEERDRAYSVAGTRPAASIDQEPETDVDGHMVRVPIGKIHPDPDNVRDELTDIEDLADSIREAGLLQPIVVRRHEDGRMVVVMGHRRLAAIKLLRWTDVNVIVRDTMRADDVLAAMLIENGQRKDLDPIEEARGLAKLKAQLDCSDNELAKKIGRSQPVVSGRLALLSLSIEEQLQIRAGGMSLVEGAHKGRLASGKVNRKGQDKNWHLSPTHDLADRAKARCTRLAHSRGRTVGGIACGACWESVIRADEREHITVIAQQIGKCPICDHAVAATDA